MAGKIPAALDHETCAGSPPARGPSSPMDSPRLGAMASLNRPTGVPLGPIGYGPSMSTALGEIALSFRVNEPPERWLLEEDDVPETPLHDAIIELLMLIMKNRVRMTEANALIARNLKCRWNPGDARVGTDPDVVWVEPAPPEGMEFKTLRVWLPTHRPPRVAVEVVSEEHPKKDYSEAPMRCARLGARELWVFDPKHFGPSDTDGPFTLQVWKLTDNPSLPALTMVRIYAGDGPAYSPELDAWLHVTDEGLRLRIAADRNGDELWLTDYEEAAQRAETHKLRADEERERAEAALQRADEEKQRAEAERQRAEAERQRAEAERQRAEAEKQRAEALEAKLRALGGGTDG